MNLYKLSGLLIFTSFISSLYSYFIDSKILIFSSLCAWLGLIFLFKLITNKKLLISLIILSISIIFFSYFSNFKINFKHAISINQNLLTLLIGVGFLKLIAIPKSEGVKNTPKGKGSFIRTYLGIHLLGSIINISSLIIIGDKLNKISSLSNLQILVLSRAFSSNAFWSPFFIAFAAISTYIPDFSTSLIFTVGILIAMIAFFITYLEVNSKYNLKNFEGYPIDIESLFLPIVLVLLILFTNYFYPNLKVILLISLFSIIITILVLCFKLGMEVAFRKLYKHILEELPKMKNELGLFLIAGLFGVVVSSILVNFNINFPFTQFDGFSASILLLVFIFLSFIGIHPIISIAIIGNWMSELNHTLFALAFLMSWALSASTSFFSGVNLTMQSRYNLSGSRIFKINFPYVFKMYIICSIILFMASDYLGL